MKKYFKILLLTFSILSVLSYDSNARSHHHTINSSSPYLNNQKLTVKELKSIHNDEYVILEGYIIKKIKNETYLFRDSTGEVQLDIDNDINYMLENVNEKTLVEISGEYDRNRFEPDEIEVESIRVLKQY